MVCGICLKHSGTGRGSFSERTDGSCTVAVGTSQMRPEISLLLFQPPAEEAVLLPFGTDMPAKRVGVSRG